MDIRATSEQLSEPVKMYGLGEIYGPGGEYIGCLGRKTYGTRFIL